MKKISLALLLIIGALLPIAVLTAPSANAAITCETSWSTRNGDAAFYGHDSGPGPDKDVLYYGQVDFLNCWDNGVRFIKVREYRVKANWDTDQCLLWDEIHVNPNALNWWDAPSNSVACRGDGSTNSVSFDPSSTNGIVNVYASLPRNERCIGATAIAGIAQGPDENMPGVPSICFLD